MQQNNKHNVLITGVASGMGLATCKYLLNKEYNVYGLDIKECQELENFHFYKCDITNQSDLLKIKEDFIKNNICFDAIINFAGIHMMGSLIETDINQINRLLSINVSGCILVNKTFFDLLDKKGRIVITTSEVASLDPMPFNGIYNISKTALDCYAQSLRQELNLLGIKVITIRPGAVNTDLCNNSKESTKQLVDSTILYKKQSKHFLHLVSKFIGTPISTDKIAKIAYKSISCKHPKLIYKKNSNIGLILLSVLPKRLQCFIIKCLLNKK